MTQDLNLHEFAENPVLFARTFLPEIFPKPIPWFHRALFAILTRQISFLDTDPELDLILKYFVDMDGRPIFSVEDGHVFMRVGRNVLVILPRGFSKTMIAAVAVPLYDTVFNFSPFTLYISHAKDHAEQQLDNVKSQLTGNELVTGAFGNFKPHRTDDERWASDIFETTHGSVFVARGKNSQIRGLNHKGRRPNKLILDDVEDDESVSTEEQRKKMRNWIYARVIPAVAEFNPDTSINMLATKLHEDSLAMRISRDPDFTTVMLDAILPDGSALWPDLMPLEKIEKRKASFQLAGEIGAFYNEYLPSRKPPKDVQIFDLSKIKAARVPDRETLVVAIAVDPAISEKRSADESVIKVVGMDLSGKLYLLDSWSARTRDPNEIMENVFKLATEWGALDYEVKVGVESIAFQVALHNSIEEEMHRRQIFFHLVKILHKTAKDVRIRGTLAPRINSGRLHVCIPDKDLIDQLTDFPYGKHDDHPDALAMAIGLLGDVVGLAGEEHSVERGEEHYTDWLPDHRACP